jgi:hypothetical protein
MRLNKIRANKMVCRNNKTKNSSKKELEWIISTMRKYFTITPQTTMNILNLANLKGCYLDSLINRVKKKNGSEIDIDSAKRK